MRKFASCLTVLAFLLSLQIRPVSAEMTNDALMQKVEFLEKRVEQLESQISAGAPAPAEGGAVASVVNGIEISGGISSSSVWNFDSPDDRTNALRVFDSNANTFNVEMVELAVEKNSEALGLGGRVDLDFLETAEVITPVGTTRDDFDVQQAYIYYNFPWIEGLTLKGGKFVTLLGAEVIEPWDNWNFSRGFLFGYAIPFTHTGLLGSYTFTDYLGVTAGVVNGWDNIEDNNDGKTFLGNLTLGPWEWLTLGINGTVGPEQDDEDGNIRGIIDAVLTVKPTPWPQLTFLFNYDYGTEGDVPVFAEDATTGEEFIASTFDATWQGFAGYVKYDFTDRLYLAIRGEWFSDEDGARTGTAQDLWEITATGAYMIVEGLWGRLEYRHDDSDTTSFLDGDTATDTQNTLSTELLYRF
ncbi:MAG: porin [Chlamydiae bacterium]|nr:porin [Chlamydiota bacterium]MBI3267357.1 porin [Chlamydiota bacterium]